MQGHRVIAGLFGVPRLAPHAGVVGPQGFVYQKNRGDETTEPAKAITSYDPDTSWTPVRDQAITVNWR